MLPDDLGQLAFGNGGILRIQYFGIRCACVTLPNITATARNLTTSSRVRRRARSNSTCRCKTLLLVIWKAVQRNVDERLERLIILIADC